MAHEGKCPHCGEDLGVMIKDLLPGGYSAVQLNPEKQRQIGLKTIAVQKRNLKRILRTAGKTVFDPDLYEMQREYWEAFDAYRKMGIGQRELRKAELQLKRAGLNDALIREIEEQRKPDKRLVNPRISGEIWVSAPVYEH